MSKVHHYELSVTWTGNSGSGSSDYRAYGRAHEVEAGGKPPIPGSADPTFRGDPARWNPEELLVTSASQCHMLWYLGLCAAEGIVVTGYVDHPRGAMIEAGDGSGQFQEILLRPRVVLANAEHIDRATALHERAHRMCYIANSVNFPIHHEPTIIA